MKGKLVYDLCGAVPCFPQRLLMEHESVHHGGVMAGNDPGIHPDGRIGRIVRIGQFPLNEVLNMTLEFCFRPRDGEEGETSFRPLVAAGIGVSGEDQNLG